MKAISQKIFNSSIILIFVLPTLLFTACSEPENKDHEHEEPSNNLENLIVELSEAQYKMANIELGGTEQKTLSNLLKVNGLMDAPPQNIISISAPLGGFVVSTSLLQGMKVKKGQALVVLQHPDYVQLQQDYIDKKSKLEFIYQDYKRQEELQKQNVNSAKIYQQAKADYISMKAQVKGLEEKLSMIGVNTKRLTEDNISGKITIHSPINGYVSTVNVNIGKYVNPTDVMFELVNTEHLHAELTVFEKDISKVKIGQNVRFTLPNEHGKERNASIYLIGRKIDNDRTVRVHAHLKKEDVELLPGMYINALIELNENLVSAVQDQAIVVSEGKNYVFVFHGKKGDKNEPFYVFEMLEVEKGVSENGYTEISFVNKKNSDTLQIVTNGTYSLLAKLKNTEEGGHDH